MFGCKNKSFAEQFFQVNDEVKDLIYSKTRELLDFAETEVLIDCFSGVGVLTNALACDKFETYAIEMEPAAVKNACETAELNGNKITNICGDVNIELPNLTQKLSNKKRRSWWTRRVKDWGKKYAERCSALTLTK